MATVEIRGMTLAALELERHKADQAMQAAREHKRELAKEIQRRLAEAEASTLIEGMTEGQIDAIARVVTQRLGAAPAPVGEG